MPLGYGGGEETITNIISNSGDVIEASCNFDVSLHDPVYISGPGFVDTASAHDPVMTECIGFVSEKISPSSCIVQTDGLLDGFSGIVAQRNYFLGLSGEMIDLQEAMDSQYSITSLAIGYDSNTIWINIAKRPIMIRNKGQSWLG